MIYRAADKNNSNLNRAMMGRFRQFLNDLHLKEVKLLGRRYTWTNDRVSPTLVRLDHVFFSNEWDDLIPNNLLQSTAAGVSDHCPLLLSTQANCGRKGRFHFEPFWPKLEGFQEIITTAWNSMSGIAHPIQRLAARLRATSRALQSWGQRKVGNMKHQLDEARELLHRLDMAQDTRPLSPEEGWLRRQLKQRCLALTSLYRTIIRARARIDWLAEGDANSRFIHSHAKYRSKKNYIAKIVSEDTILTAQEEKEEAIWEF